ncbi:adenylate/guanylate cyclase domain-containing protein [Mesorhizobium delmotii]|uniref:Adenylate cyclase 3 n=1 Tax=Mesorhizobium delmotii TaxID=1631247 RepID=A0A2P9AKT4_9HYPH
MADERPQRRLAAILAADVVGYSLLMGQDESGTLATLKARRREVLEPLVARYHGRIFKVTGDGVLVEFGSAVNAVQCAVDLQHDMASANSDLPEARRIALRIGVNLGDIIVEGSDLYGDGINIAARLEGVAEPGSVLVSGTVFDYVRNKVKAGFEDLGTQTLKNIAEPVRVYRVTGTGRVSVTTPRAVTDKPSIAVLPLVNMSGDPEQAYFADGITDDIIIELSRFRELSVTGRNSSFVYRDKAVNLQQIGRELGVQYLLEGSVRKLGSRVRITAQLIDTATGTHVWAERYDRDIQGIFDVQDEIIGMIVATLSGHIINATTMRAKRKPPSSWQAYDCFLMGMECYGLPRMRENVKRAIEFFQKAIETDPQYARAYGKLGASYTLLAVNTRGDFDARARAMASAQRYAQKGVSLDGSDADSLLALGYVSVGQRQLCRRRTPHRACLRPQSSQRRHRDELRDGSVHFRSGGAGHCAGRGRDPPQSRPFRRRSVRFGGGPFLRASQ